MPIRRQFVDSFDFFIQNCVNIRPMPDLSGTRAGWALSCLNVPHDRAAVAMHVAQTRPGYVLLLSIKHLQCVPVSTYRYNEV